MPPARLIVYPPDENGRRRIRWDGQSIGGVAHQPYDIAVFLHEAGREDSEAFDLTGDGVERRGGGPELSRVTAVTAPVEPVALTFVGSR
ncbi:hypothetical protein [Streptomyces sp. NPDC058613]|uniref:hypothetical protein n=1 Tax=unclassified Streptomyces TaxID=2593676 RepID=UPI00365C4921